MWLCTNAADELEHSRAGEQDLRQQMVDALRAVEVEGHRKVEESYQEASYAVSKALERLDTANREAAEAKQRCKGLEKKETEARMEAKAAKEEIVRCDTML